MTGIKKHIEDVHGVYVSQLKAAHIEFIKETKDTKTKKEEPKENIHYLGLCKGAYLKLYSVRILVI